MLKLILGRLGGPYVAGALALLIALFGFAIWMGINKIASQGAEIAQLRAAVAAEKAARERDVAGLTTLSQGILSAASARAVDEKTLAESIDAKNPQPVSPGLARFLDSLRASGPAPAASAAASAHPAARR